MLVDVALIRLDLVHHPVQITAGVDPVEARTFDQAVVDRPDFSCLVFADEKGVLLGQRNSANTALYGVIVNFKPAIEA